MKFRFNITFLICILFFSSFAFAMNFTPEEMYNSIVVVYTDYGVGSGFAIKENLLVTNAHVVGSSKTVTINLYNGEKCKGEVIKADQEKDLALVAVNKKFNPLTVNEGTLNIGKEVYAIGAPKDIPYTLTKGIISALNRKIGKNEYIQIDASVNTGNSGGPLVDENGQVIGIITMKIADAEGIGFAIGVNDIKAFIDGTSVNNIEITEDIEEQESSIYGEEYKKIIRENEILRIVIIIMSVLLVVLIGIIIKLAVKSKKKDEFDFEIEIEE